MEAGTNVLLPYFIAHGHSFEHSFREKGPHINQKLFTLGQRSSRIRGGKGGNQFWTPVYLARQADVHGIHIEAAVLREHFASRIGLLNFQPLTLNAPDVVSGVAWWISVLSDRSHRVTHSARTATLP